MANKTDNQVLTDAESHIKQAWELLQQESTRLRQEETRLHQEREEFDSMSKRVADVHFSATVKLNVGGHHFTTTVQTLTNDQNSMLAAMFSGRFDTQPSEDGSFFIDRDGTHFRFILNFLRDGKLILPEGATFHKELEAEATFYQIQGILDELKRIKPSMPFEESVILTNREYRQKLKGWLPEDLKGEWRLLFQASRDGFGAEAFHSKCDNKGPTVTIVKSGEYIFGGFTEVSWTSGKRNDLKCYQAFLFSIINPQGLESTTLPLRTGANSGAMACCSDYGPTFGNGHDLHISGNANGNKNSYSFHSSYSFPPGKGNTFFTGARYFTVSNYEVFGLSD